MGKNEALQKAHLDLGVTYGVTTKDLLGQWVSESRMRQGRWTAVTETSFPWEREALEFLRDRLPDYEPWRAWSNFEFIHDEGRVNEVDVLVLTPVGFVLVEVKSRPGTLRGDPYSWTWTTEGHQVTTDNPLPLANRKAKRLATLCRTWGTATALSLNLPRGKQKSADARNDMLLV
jgi:hypothetical protein